jgi:hypothetical protein
MSQVHAPKSSLRSRVSGNGRNEGEAVGSGGADVVSTLMVGIATVLSPLPASPELSSLVDSFDDDGASDVAIEAVGKLVVSIPD